MSVSLLFEHNLGLNITRAEFKNYLKTYFLFQGTLYDQIDGVALGSPLDLSWLIFSWVITKLCGWIHFENVR